MTSVNCIVRLEATTRSTDDDVVEDELDDLRPEWRDDHAPQKSLIPDGFHLLFPVRPAGEWDCHCAAEGEYTAGKRAAELDDGEDVLDGIRHIGVAECTTRVGLRCCRPGEQDYWQQCNEAGSDCPVNSMTSRFIGTALSLAGRDLCTHRLWGWLERPKTVRKF